MFKKLMLLSKCYYLVVSMILCATPGLLAVEARLGNIERQLGEVISRLDSIYSFVIKTEASVVERASSAKLNSELGVVLRDAVRKRTDEEVVAAMRDAVAKGFTVGESFVGRTLGDELRYREEDGTRMPKSKAYWAEIGGKS